MSATHDYTERSLGHDFTIITVREGGFYVRACGWGRGVRNGDFLILPNNGGVDGEVARYEAGGPVSTRYQVLMVEYYRDPPDMWSAELKFAPRLAE